MMVTIDRQTHWPSAAGPRPELTLVVPTRNERHNITQLIDEVRRNTRGRRVELLVVDDSDDGTAAEATRSARAAADGFTVRVLHREPGERDGGLGGAVRLGLHHATASTVGVMDADLQHPPAMVSALVHALDEAGADVAIGSRYCAGGSAPGLSTLRTFISRCAVALAKTFFPRRLGRLRDPMSGFFVLHPDDLDLSQLRPDGFKFLLELLITNPQLRTIEFPIRLDSRRGGASKAGAREAATLLRKLSRLRWATIRFSRARAVPAVPAPRGWPPYLRPTP